MIIRLFMIPLVFQFVAILEGVLAKISRYDEGTLFSSFLSFTVRFFFLQSPSLFFLKLFFKKIHFIF